MGLSFGRSAFSLHVAVQRARLSYFPFGKYPEGDSVSPTGYFFLPAQPKTGFFLAPSLRGLTYFPWRFFFFCPRLFLHRRLFGLGDAEAPLQQVNPASRPQSLRAVSSDTPPNFNQWRRAATCAPLSHKPAMSSFFCFLDPQATCGIILLIVLDGVVA